MMAPKLLSIILRLLFLMSVSPPRSNSLIAEGGHLSLTQGEVIEYCEWESFNATCSQDEVIVIGSAKYGRMRLGKCVTKDYGHIGCASDVTSYFDSRCSGRHSCEISVIKLHDKLSCPTDFKSYLEASYECVKVSVSSEDYCSNSTRSAPTGLLASVTVMDRVLGSSSSSSSVDCPWVLRMESHQRINVSLFDFSVPSGEGVVGFAFSRPRAPPGECIDYGVISEGWGPGQLNTTICGGRQRQSVVYVSSSNTVEIRLRNSPNKMFYFLLKYEAFGCSPLVAPPGAWVENSSHEAVIRCNETEESWRLICRGTFWDGYVGNCSPPAPASRNSEQEWQMENSFPYGILLVVALGVVIGVAVGVLMLLAVIAYMRRRRLCKIRSRSNYIIDEALMAIQSIDGKTAAEVGGGGGGGGCPDRHRTHPPMLFKPNPAAVRAPGGCEILLNRRGSWQRTRPLPDPARTPPVGSGGLAMIPISAAELPLLSPDEQHQHQIASTGEGGEGGGGIFGTFGTDYSSEQSSIDLLRRSSGSGAGTRPPLPPPIIGVGPGTAPGMATAVARESGPYYFKLDLNKSGGGRHSHHDGGVSPCFMCQAGTPRGPRPIIAISTVNQIQP